MKIFSFLKFFKAKKQIHNKVNIVKIVIQF